MNLFKPLNPQQAASHLDSYFQKLQAKNHPKPTQIKVYSQKLGLDYSFPSDSTNQPYHVASIGKVFTATLVQMLAEKRASLSKGSDSPFFSPTDAGAAFCLSEHRLRRQVTIEHLLGHTSGIADYFEGSTTSGKSFMDEVLSNPQFHWTPQKLLDFTREHQTAVGIPGKVFNYSDTGYILLGLIIEKVTGKSFAENLGMKSSCPWRWVTHT